MLSDKVHTSGDCDADDDDNDDDYNPNDEDESDDDVNTGSDFQQRSDDDVNNDACMTKSEESATKVKAKHWNNTDVHPNVEVEVAEFLNQQRPNALNSAKAKTKNVV